MDIIKQSMPNIINIECSSYHNELWIESETQKVIKHKKTDKKNNSLIKKELKKMQKFSKSYKIEK